MVNFRVADLDAMLAQLRADGIEAPSRNPSTAGAAGPFIRPSSCSPALRGVFAVACGTGGCWLRKA